MRQLRIALDLHGVLLNFKQGYADLHDLHLAEVDPHIIATGLEPLSADFWEGLPFNCVQAKKIIEVVEYFDPQFSILTHAPTLEAVIGSTKACETLFRIPRSRVLTVEDREDKALKYGRMFDVLVDDNEDTCLEWKEETLAAVHFEPIHGGSKMSTLVTALAFIAAIKVYSDED